ncbi:MAG TPA: GNAT family N-acetyltransferase [Acidimicrobiales bacterium]|nr:GNAT family N-acetyltransferase [Acidimicrobiales bacterium]
MSVGERPGADIRTIAMEEVDAAAVCAARAFYEDPVLGWVQPSLLRQQRRFPGVFSAVVADSLATTWVAAVDGRVRGVASWLAPGDYPRSPRRDARLAARALPAFLPPSDRSPTGIRLALAIERAHPRHRHWYLALLAVDPLVQHRGIGTALLQPGLDRADQDGVPAYLETQKPENVVWYGRSGFRQTGEFRVPPCPPVWALTRDPVPPGPG